MPDADEPVLTDGTVALRHWSAVDAGWYAEQSRDPQIQRFTSDPPDLTAEAVARAIAASAADPGAVAFLIVDAVSGTRLGNLATQLSGCVADLSYWVAPAARGRSVAGRALRLLSDRLLEDGRVCELRLWTHADNHASQGAARRAGYRPDLDRDGPRTVRGEVWATLAFRRVS